MNVESYLDDDGKQALAAIREAIDPMWDVEGAKNWQPPDPDHRLTYALSKQQDKFVLKVLFELADSWAERKAKEIVSAHKGQVVVGTASGEAFSSYPGPSENIAPHVSKRIIAPGYSIGHGRYRAGTIGVIVNIRGTTTDEPGVLTAAHVVALNHRTVNKQDPIYSPGKPEVGEALTRRHRMGRLRDFVDLLDEQSDDFNVFADTDAALVDLTEVDLQDRQIPDGSMVPDHAKIKGKPNLDLSAPKYLMPLSRVAVEESIPDLLGTKVYKFGRTSGLTSGYLRDVAIRAKRLRLPNQRYYLYEGLLAIEREGDNLFSAPGDSGAPLYTADGTLLGFVIGADRDNSFACAAWRSLKAMQVDLLGAE